MIQFSTKEMLTIKAKVTPELINTLIKNNDIILNNPILVPPDNRATWNLYYFCPEHATRLTWDRNKPELHCCPVDGKVFTGKPYDGAWWRYLNGLNAKACYDLGLLWQLTNDGIYLDKVRGILLEYAKYYPDYQPHGGIPYNGPGKANAQTLCEANCHLDFIRGYDFIKEALTNDEQQTIEVRLMREGADFLMAHRTNQLHNHEMKINATIGFIGLVLNEESYLEFALSTPYGIHHQLNHGLMGDGMWYEGSIHYHYYALQAILKFETAAVNTKYSISSNPNFLRMLKFPLNLVMNTGDFPRLNDCIAGQEKLTHAHLFEFAYKHFPCDEFAAALNSIYQNISRNNIDALLYGVNYLPKAPCLQAKSGHYPDEGFTLALSPHLNGKNNALLYKHAPYGGEHDHYDRLNFILSRHGKEVLPDLGTTGYGAEPHYGYYKNTATHNTLTVNQQNQPPINTKIIEFTESKKYTFIDAEVDWTKPEATVDSHTIVQWDKKSYQQIKFRRQMLWLGEALIEINQIENPEQQQLDLTYHIRGKHILSNQWHTVFNSFSGPLARMKNIKELSIEATQTLEYAIEDQSHFYQSLYVNKPCDLLTGYAPDNPATTDLSYTLVRSKANQLTTVMLHDLSDNKEFKLISINESNDTIDVLYEQYGVKKSFKFPK